jgi:hypothetical protein
MGFMLLFQPPPFPFLSPHARPSVWHDSVSKPPTPTAVKAEGKEEKEGPEKEGEEKNGEGGPAGPRAR